MKKTTTRFLALPALALAGALALSACSNSVPEDQRTASAAPAPTNASGATLAPAEGSGNAADIMFAQMMKIHHEQALTLSDLVLAKDGIDPRVKSMAEKIKAAQGPEIDQMRGWLAGWGAPESGSEAHMMHMDGMVSQEGLDALKAADAKEGQKLFLSHMIEHHEGAVTMAEDELKQGSNAEAKKLAQTIIDAQKQEIDEMKTLLGELK